MENSSKKKVSIIGGGPSALMLAATLEHSKFEVTIYEQKPSLGRKFLVAGDGGLNLSHSENLDLFLKKYTPSTFISPFINQFSNQDLRDWLLEIGIETFVGSSKRIFPVKSIKPIQVLNAIVNRIKTLHVNILNNYTWKGWDHNNELIFQTKNDLIKIKSDINIFALGGKSWSITGSDGAWQNEFEKKKINIIPFQASNCAYEIKFPEAIKTQIEGKPLKNISITCNNKTIFGEAVLTQFGIEGNAIYALSSEIRNNIKTNQEAAISIDFKPLISIENIIEKLATPHKTSWTEYISKQLNLNKTQILLLKSHLNKEEFQNIKILAQSIKTFPLTIIGLAPIDEAISTVGGIDLKEIDENCQLNKLPNHYVIGEMLNWDAPTGGYLLQACFSMGYCLGKTLNK